MTKKYLVSSLLLLLSISGGVSLATASVSADSSPAVVAVKSDEVAPSSDFISKFNDSIVLENNAFTIDYSKLPTGTTSDELDKLQTIVNENNLVLKNNAGNQAVQPVSPQASSSNSSILTRSKYHEGSNYVHVYWWGLRIGVKKSTINSIGAGVAIGGIRLPQPLLSKLVSTAGVVLGAVPGGIVFNSTPGVKSVWGMEWQ